MCACVRACVHRGLHSLAVRLFCTIKYITSPVYDCIIITNLLCVKALEDGTLEEIEEQAKTTKRKRKSGKKDDDPDMVSIDRINYGVFWD